MTPRDRRTLEQLREEIRAAGILPERWELALVDVLRNADADLVERATRAAKAPGLPRWVAVKRAFTVGSTRAAKLCERFGLNPEEVM